MGWADLRLEASFFAAFLDTSATVSHSLSRAMMCAYTMWFAEQTSEELLLASGIRSQALVSMRTATGRKGWPLDLGLSSLLRPLLCLFWHAGVLLKHDCVTLSITDTTNLDDG